MSIEPIQLFNYKTKDFETASVNSDDTCESVCIFMCKRLNIAPVTRLLFGLRISNTQNWLPSSHTLELNVKYDFRMRFKIPNLTTLKKLDLNTYDYFYHQVRYDLVNDKIPEIKYPAFKDNVLGLGVVDMYIDMIEKECTIDDLEKNYKRYIPKELARNHLYFAKRNIHKGLRDIKKKDHDIFYVKGSYLEMIRSLAPNYLIEEFHGTADYLPEDEFKTGTCPVQIEFNPFHEEQPGLRVFYNYKKEWKHISRLENIYSLCREADDVVNLELSEHPNGFKLHFSSIPDLESFVTYIAGYYRLSVKWTEDLCAGYLTPSLLELKELKCHGPIGGEYSYATIREKNKNREGNCIVRQCEKNYDTYFIDINTKGSQTETFKITRRAQQWILHMRECERSFDKLPDLINSIDTKGSPKFRIPMSKYDKQPNLLICLPRNQVTSKKTVSKVNEAELHRNRVQIIDPKIDLRWYKNSQRHCEDGRMIQMRADWLLPEHTNMNVTLKILKTDKDFTDFMQLANRWSKMYSPECLQFFGLTLSSPYTLVMEHASFGPLNKFLGREKISILALLEAVHSLVRAVVYMQEKKFFHGYIRCSKLLVIKYNAGSNLLLVKLADPGFPKPYSLQDLPWIPVEFFDMPQLAKEDLSSELWAFATTVYEIFSGGRTIQYSRDELALIKEKYERNHGLIPAPCSDCPQQIMAIIRDGWSRDPDKRFSQQSIFGRLSSAKQALSSTYTRPRIVDDDDTFSQHSGSDYSDTTEEIFLNGHSDSEGSIEQAAHVRRSLSHLNPSISQNAFDITNSVWVLKNGKLACGDRIGEGHYGIVFKGVYSLKNKLEPIQVAIKTLNEKNHVRDFKREIRIMQTLRHPNIVRILDYVDDGTIHFIIMEYIECGAFSTYLASNKPRLTNERLLHFSYDIAKGMHYLRTQNVIHRDLAARNILVGNDCLKISDFGLAQLADINGYYYTQNKYRDLPIMWYSLEALRTNKFSFQSDVWSYGVTLFEVFSRGQLPEFLNCSEVNATEVINKLESGERLPRPELCPENIYNELMMPCWHVNPKRRPDFLELMGKIEILLSEFGECA